MSQKLTMHAAGVSNPEVKLRGAVVHLWPI
jgi:hypothetical protein